MINQTKDEFKPDALVQVVRELQLELPLPGFDSH